MDNWKLAYNICIVQIKQRIEKYINIKHQKKYFIENLLNILIKKWGFFGWKFIFYKKLLIFIKK